VMFRSCVSDLSVLTTCRKRRHGAIFLLLRISISDLEPDPSNQLRTLEAEVLVGGIRGNNAVSVYLRILDVQLQTLPPGSPSLADATYPSNRSGSPGEYIIQNEETGVRVVITSIWGGGQVRMSG